MANELRVGDIARWDDDDWTVAAIDWPTVTIEHRISKNLVAVEGRHLLKSVRRSARPPRHETKSPNHLDYDPHRAGGFDRAGVLDSLNGSERARAEKLEKVVVSFIDDGIPQREGMTRAEVAAELYGFSPATLYRYKKRYVEHGLAGLADLRSSKPKFKLSHVDYRLVDEIINLKVSETQRTTGTRSRFIRRLKARIEQDYPKDDRPVVPSDATLYRYLNHFLQADYTFADATTRRNNDRRAQHRHAPRNPKRPGELVQLDSTTLDVMVKPNGPGKPFRPKISAAIDAASHSLLAWIITEGDPKTLDVQLMLHDILTPLPLRPRFDYNLAWQRQMTSLADHITDDGVEAAIAEFPIVVPEAFVVDNGSVYVSAAAHSAIDSMRADLIRARKARPTDKPQIERLFSTINTLFCQHLPGYVSYTSSRRGTHQEIEASDKLLTLEEFKAMFMSFVLLTYQTRPIAGLRTPGSTANVDLSPNEAFARYVSWTGLIPTPAMDSQVAMELLPRRDVKVTAKGVQLNRRHYDGPALEFCRDIPGPYDGKWKVYYDPRDPTEVFVRDPGNGTYHAARWTKDPGPSAPMLRHSAASPETRLTTATGIDPIDLANAVDHSTNPNLRSDLDSARVAAEATQSGKVPPLVDESHDDPAHDTNASAPEPQWAIESQTQDVANAEPTVLENYD